MCVCMYICVCVYVCIYVSMYVCVCVFVCIYVCMYARMYVMCVCVYMHVCMYVCIYLFDNIFYINRSTIISILSTLSSLITRYISDVTCKLGTKVVQSL